ncbi:MAG: nucleotide exchange factor GrpE [Clostridia bacterium]|nr:nucleotide exchange factor GrpE [Clostridia bacterium]
MVDSVDENNQEVLLEEENQLEEKPAGESPLQETGIGKEVPEEEAREEREAEGEESQLPSQEQLAELNYQLERKKAELEELKNRLLRLQSDFENYRRRVKKEIEETIRYGGERVISNLLPVMDNFERALAAVPDNPEASQFAVGMEMIYRQLKEVLEKEGLQEIPALLEPFNPEKHEAVMQVITDEYDDNIIVEEFKKGYTLYDKVLRPSAVKVAKNEGR